MYKKKACLIINPHAGKMRIKNMLYQIVEELSEFSISSTVYLTQYPGHAVEIARNIKNTDYDMVICSGGDGTLNETASGIIQSGSNIPVGYIPAGSTNDFATSLGLSKNMRRAARDIAQGRLCKIDMGQFQDSFFSYVASFGIFTRASYAADQNVKNLLGSAAYILEGINDIWKVHEYEMTVWFGDQEVHDSFIFGAVANTTSLGGILTIDPTDVNIDDGKFEYLFVKRPKNVAELIKAINAISSYDYKSDQLYFGSVDRITINTDYKLDWSLDGEHTESENDVKIVNLNHALNMILPSRNNQLLEIKQ